MNFNIARKIATTEDIYREAKRVAHLPGPIAGDAILLPRFLDEVFDRAQILGAPQETTIVFLEAGARPLFAAASLMARVTGEFPAGQLKSVWATMGNYRQIKADPSQATAFIKYLSDEGVIGPQIKHVLVVDTDTGFGGHGGTELIFAKPF